jgi:hypothetical protein
LAVSLDAAVIPYVFPSGPDSDLTFELTRARDSDNVKKKKLVQRRAIAPRVQRIRWAAVAGLLSARETVAATKEKTELK